MAVLDYSRLFQTVPELDCATTNTLTVIGDTLSGSMPFYGIPHRRTSMV